MVYKDINDYYLIDMICENDELSYGMLFDKYRPLIKKIASNFYRNYKNYGYEYDDFLQEGYLGFYKALKNFNLNKSVLFYTFVSLCVNRQLISFVNKISSKAYNYILLPLDEYDLIYTGVKENNDYYLEELINEVINESSIEDASVFELRYNNFSYKEIEVLLDIDYAQAEYRYRKLKLLLKDKIDSLIKKKIYN